MVIGICIWADESPQWLMAAITSMAPALDHLVAVDGKYLLYPGSMQRPASDIDQSHAVLEACNAVDLAVTLFRPNRPFEGNEVQKRQLSIDLAKTVAGPDDYFLVFDADMVAQSIAPDFKQALAEENPLVAEYGVYDWGTHAQMVKDNKGVEQVKAAQSVTNIRGIYKNLDGLQYINAHYVVVGMHEGEPIFLFGNPSMHQPYAPAFDMSWYLKMDHRNRNREVNRTNAAMEYYAKRDEYRVEALGHSFFEGLDGEWHEI